MGEVIVDAYVSTNLMCCLVFIPAKACCVLLCKSQQRLLVTYMIVQRMSHSIGVDFQPLDLAVKFQGARDKR